jgi:general secretion pathway protein D
MAMTTSSLVARRLGWAACTVCIAVFGIAPQARAQHDSTITTRGDSVMIRLVDADLRGAIQSLARFVDRPVVFGGVSNARVTLETPAPVPRADVQRLLRGVLESQGFELIADSGLYRVRPHQTTPNPAEAPPIQRASNGSVELFSIHLRHARAADVAATVNALYGRTSALGEIGAPPETLSEQLRQNQIPAGAVTSPGQAPLAAGRAAVLTGDVTIVPDPRSNSLLIRASASDFELITAAVDVLDVRPLQVLIEVLIAEARRDRTFSFGVDATTGPTRVRGSNANVASSQSSGGTLGDLVVKVMNVGGINLNAVLSAAAERGDVHILSRPVVIAANNEQAQLLVGSQRPFVQVSRSLPTDAATRDEVVQYRDVGTRLVVRPTISTDGYVVLEVTQEVNSATSEIAFNAPVISTRSVQTQLLIKDGQTVALGGLSDKQRDVSQGGIPVLSSIPLIGGLFGHTNRQTSETELFVFLTPHVIRSDAQADSLTKPMLDRASEDKR